MPYRLLTTLGKPIGDRTKPLPLRVAILCASLAAIAAPVAASPAETAQSDTKNGHLTTDHKHQPDRFSVPHRIIIRSKPLQQAVVDFVEQTDIGIVIAPGVDKSLRLPAVQGHMTATAALQRLLNGHDLEAINHSNAYYLIDNASIIDSVTRPSHSAAMIEEIVVTGSWTSPSRFPSANNITAWDQPAFDEYGLTSATDLIAYVPSVSGTENQSNQFDNNFSAGTSNINLRGLGVSRTLVLLNGRRTVNSALPHDDGQSYVDLNSLPINAVTRVELLKDGAAATYGSDAVAGVVNLITQQPEDGLTLKGQYKAIDESNGDWNLAAIWAQQSEHWQWMSSLEYNKRNELTVEDRQQITQPRIDIPSSGRVVFGESSIGNPGAFVPIDAATAIDGISDSELNSLVIEDNFVADPSCADFGRLLNNNRCSYGYLASDNLVEEETQLRWFNRAQWHLNETTELYGELLLAQTDVPNWKTSPSYAPTEEVDIAYYIPVDHPALTAFAASNPETLAGAAADFSGGGLYLGRARPAGSDAGQEGSRDYRTLRLLLGATVEHPEYSTDIAIMYARNRAKAYTPDTHKGRWQQALLGFGGPNCSGTVAGENGCEYFNPFSSALPASAIYDPALVNSNELNEWLVGDATQTNTSELFTADWLVQSEQPDKGISIAIGAQVRHETLDIHYSENSQLGRIDDTNQAPENDLIFFAGGEDDQLEQTTIALFSEARINLSRDLELQLAIRYEDYLDEVGNSLDPKIAALWRLNDNISLRGSASTSFRAPSLNQTGQNSTTQEFLGYAGTFKSTYRIGNPNLNAEDADNLNIGLLWQTPEGFSGSLDFWQIHLDDPILQQSANDIVNHVVSQPNSNYANQVIFDSGDHISHVITHYVNGPDITTQGADIHFHKTWLGSQRLIKLEFNATYTHRYDVDGSELRDSFDAVGHSNSGTFLNPIPKWKGNAALRIEQGNHIASLRWNYVDGYVDEGLSILANSINEAELIDGKVNSFQSWDFLYRYQMNAQQWSISLAINNLTDEEPPEVKDELRYESSLHNAFGRTATLSIDYHYL